MSGGEQSPWRRAVSKLGSPFRHTFRLLGRIAQTTSETELRAINVAIGSLFLAVLDADGRQTDEELARIEELFIANFGKREARHVREALKGAKNIDIAAQCELLRGLEQDEASELIRGMVEIGFADEGVSAEELVVIRAAAHEFKLDDAFVGQCVAEVRSERAKRGSAIRSAAGIIIALVVMAIFVFTATFLKSVIFGLILAYFFLPLQRWYQYRFFPHPWVQALERLLGAIMSPIVLVTNRIKGFFSQSHVERPHAEADRRLGQSCRATLLTLLVMVVLMGWAVVRFSSPYVASVAEMVTHAQSTPKPAPPPTTKPRAPLPAVPEKSAVEKNASKKNAADESPNESLSDPTDPAPTDDSNAPSPSSDVPDSQAADEPDDEPLGGGIPWLEQYRPDLAKVPIIRLASKTAEEYLTDPVKRKELIAMALKNAQPIVLRAGGMLATLAHWLLDGMLTLFFFTFFLQKIAAGQVRQLGRPKPPGQHIVEAIFESGWMPDTSVSALREAQIILDEVISMLQTWVKGYLWIIIIETLIYTLVFVLLGVPYAPIFGLIAGSTILLPFIGPIIGCLLTVIVTFATHSQSVTLAASIILVYFVVHGVIEQLILYPAFVGEALGLNTLETIIVVLLGGIVAGFAGVIFAVPAAAILKYLVPKIYATLSQRSAAAKAAAALTQSPP